jgi:hypothetical protein
MPCFVEEGHHCEGCEMDIPKALLDEVYREKDCSLCIYHGVNGKVKVYKVDECPACYYLHYFHKSLAGRQWLMDLKKLRCLCKGCSGD